MKTKLSLSVTDYLNGNLNAFQLRERIHFILEEEPMSHLEKMRIKVCLEQAIGSAIIQNILPLILG